MTKNKPYSMREAAAMLGVSTQRVAVLVREGKLPSTKTLEWGRIRYWIPRSAVVARQKHKAAA